MATKQGRHGVKPRPQRRLIIIGGHEDKEDKCEILKEVVSAAGDKKIIVATCASSVEEQLWEEYKTAFSKLSDRKIEHLSLKSRQDADWQAAIKMLEDAGVLFFAGGDQKPLLEIYLGSPLLEYIVQNVKKSSLTLAGTSAGASVLGETVIVGGISDSIMDAAATLQTVPGFGLVKSTVIDQHFAQRGRFDRLLFAVTKTQLIGIGIDENTAIVTDGEEEFYVIGENAALVLDVSSAHCVNEKNRLNEKSVSVFDGKFHSLNQGCVFNLSTRKPFRMTNL